ncbi:MAG: DUF1553 domain-containing protein [Planctomycetaceae bacterium]|nr:MAG: DUF1553 domain-containing protein [Planctomycetaceae bacterium]
MMLAFSSIRLVVLAILSADPQRPVHFDTEIIPVLTRAGCNAGACHGAAAGRGGFRLSLLGADPAADHESIVHQFEGRRVHPVDPELSLLLRKPTGGLDHGGDVVLREDGPGFERIMSWIRAGSPRGAPRTLTAFEVMKEASIGDELPVEVPLRAVASFDGGPPEDVTRWTLWTSTDPSAVRVESDHVVKLSRPGQHVLIGRFLDRVVAVRFSVPLPAEPVDLTAEPRNGFIDDEVLRVLSELRLPVSPPASDAVWLRRVSLDLTGRLPAPERTEAFLADASSEKRGRMVETLLQDDGFADFWTWRLAKLLRLHSLPNEPESLRAYSVWLRGEIVRGAGLDSLARQLLTATGDSHVVGPANFGRMVGDARGHAELFSRFFLGSRMGCANCHNHPLDRWTQDDYHGLAAAFAKLDRGRQVRWLPRGEVTNLRTNEPAVPRIPGVRDLAAGDDPPRELTSWLFEEEPRLFARATVNRLWRGMFGRGLVEPTDDLRDTNPATHPELLDQLADDFIANGYDIRQTLRRIALSETYGRGEAVLPGNVADDRFYSRAYSRPLEPEVLMDAIADVTGVADSFPGSGFGRAIEIVDPLVPVTALDLLGRCPSAGGCDEGMAGTGGLPAQLHLLNGDLINRKLISDEGRLGQRIAEGRSDREIVAEFHLLGLGRQPTDAELTAWCERLATGDVRQRRLRLEDFVWSLLNSRSFRDNH